MKKVDLLLSTLKVMAEHKELSNLNHIKKDISAEITIKGGKQTSTINVFESLGVYFLNISNAVTFQFKNEKEYKEYMDKNVVEYKNEKDMYINGFNQMSEKSWNEWNGKEEADE